MFDLNSAQDRRKTILIIGINSFLGSNLAEFLKKTIVWWGLIIKKSTAPWYSSFAL